MSKMSESFLLIIIFIFAGTSEIIMGMPLLMKKIKPNWYYGFRTPKTRSDEKIWYKINKYFGRDMIICGIILIIGSLFLITTIDLFTTEEIVIVLMVFTLFPLAFAIVRGFLYLKEL